MKAKLPKVRVEERMTFPRGGAMTFWEVCVPFPSKEYAARFARSINRTRKLVLERS